jgi:hypothetical protein
MICKHRRPTVEVQDALRTTRWFLLGMALLASLTSAARAASKGSICVAAVTEEMRKSDQGDPTGQGRSALKYQFTVKIDRGERILVPKLNAVRLAGLDTDRKHEVRIFDGADLIESFFFTFRSRGANDLCLSFSPFYRTWSLQPPGRQPWCKCR